MVLGCLVIGLGRRCDPFCLSNVGAYSLEAAQLKPFARRSSRHINMPFLLIEWSTKSLATPFLPTFDVR